MSPNARTATGARHPAGVEPRVDDLAAAPAVAPASSATPTANANFALYDPHADPHDRDRNPVLYYTAVFMKLLLGGVFLFFGMHTLLWFPDRCRRGASARQRPCRRPDAAARVVTRRRRSGAPVAQGRHVRRFDAFNRGLHLALMTSFLGLAATGLPLLFSGAPWAARLSRLFGGFQAAGALHRVFAVRDDHHVRRCTSAASCTAS